MDISISTDRLISASKSNLNLD